MAPTSSQSSVEAGHQAESPGRYRGFSAVLDIVENKIHTGAIPGTLVLSADVLSAARPAPSNSYTLFWN